MLVLLIVFELISIVIYSIMTMHDSFSAVIDNYTGLYSDKPVGMAIMAILGGWLFAPYFIYLAYKYIKITNIKE